MFSLFFSLKCSVSCGTGIQVRKIECVDAFGRMNTNCDSKTKPLPAQSCSTGIQCSTQTTVTQSSPSTQPQQQQKQQQQFKKPTNSEVPKKQILFFFFSFS